MVWISLFAYIYYIRTATMHFAEVVWLIIFTFRRNKCRIMNYNYPRLSVGLENHSFTVLTNGFPLVLLYILNRSTPRFIRLIPLNLVQWFPIFRVLHLN